jgi:hypothetical protein
MDEEDDDLMENDEVRDDMSENDNDLEEERQLSKLKN